MSTRKPLSEQQPWWKWNNSRLLHHCPGFELAQFRYTQSWSWPSSPSYLGPWTPPPHRHFSPHPPSSQSTDTVYSLCISMAVWMGPGQYTLNKSTLNVWAYSYQMRDKHKPQHVSQMDTRAVCHSSTCQIWQGWISIIFCAHCIFKSTSCTLLPPKPVLMRHNKASCITRKSVSLTCSYTYSTHTQQWRNKVLNFHFELRSPGLAEKISLSLSAWCPVQLPAVTLCILLGLMSQAIKSVSPLVSQLLRVLSGTHSPSLF